MKTPSLLAFSFLFAALPAYAGTAAAVPERCDVKWLERALPVFDQGGKPADPDSYVRDVQKDGATTFELKFGVAKLCDQGAWRQVLAEPLSAAAASGNISPALKFYSEGGAAAAYSAGRISQAKLLLVVSDFYAKVDAKALRALAVADEAMEAAVKLELAERKSEVRLVAAGLLAGSGAAFGNTIHVTYAPKTGGSAKLSPTEVVPAYRALTDEQGRPGEKILEFRKEVMELTVLLDRLAKSEAAVEARFGAKVPGLNDMVSGAPGFTAADPKKAADDVAFKAALASLAGAPATPALTDETAHGNAILDRVDLGIRNRLLVRNAELTSANAAAKARIGDKTFAQIGASARLAESGKDLRQGSLQKAVLDRLAESADYRELDGLYDAAVQRKDEAWLKSPAGIQAKETLERIRADAMSATTGTPDKRGVTFTVGGKPMTLDNNAAVPDQVDGDAAYRHDTAGMIAGLILNGQRKEGKLQALIAAIKGEGQPGGATTGNLGAEERRVADQVPPPTSAAVAAGAAGCKDPRDVWQSDREIYARRQAAAEGDLASRNQTDRTALTTTAAGRTTAWETGCKAKKDAAAAIVKDHFESQAAHAKRKKDAMDAAVVWCADEKKRIDGLNAADLTAFNARTQGKGADNPENVRTAAAKALLDDYAVQVKATIGTLREQYTKTKPYNDRQKKLSEITGSSDRLPTFTARWFDKIWPSDPAKFAVATADCIKKLGLENGTITQYRDPSSPDDVDKHCDVAKGLEEYVNSKEAKDSIGVPEEE